MRIHYKSILHNNLNTSPLLSESIPPLTIFDLNNYTCGGNNTSNCLNICLTSFKELKLTSWLEYGCCTCDPHIQHWECAETNGTFTNEYSTTPGTVTKILNDLKWLTLEKRRKVARFTTMFKVVSGLSATRFPPYILFKRRQGTRQFHLKKFIQVGAKTNKYQHSFIARTIRDWNSLPSSVIEKQSVEAFKKAVMCYL